MITSVLVMGCIGSCFAAGIGASVFGPTAASAFETATVSSAESAETANASAMKTMQARAIETATAVPTPPHWQTVVYQEPFTAAAAGWPNDVGHCYWKDGAYHAAAGSTCYAPIGKQTSFDLTVDVKQLSGDTKVPHGLVVALDDFNNYYE